MKKSKPAPIEVSPVVAADVVHEGIFGIHQVAQIRPSPDNRKRFNEAALQELAASVKADGVAQPILIRPVEPTTEQPEVFEIVAGERRWRASGIAQLATIPAMVRSMTDLQAAKLRILENLQREDPHPLEEAEGYEQLMMKHGYNADQLADEIKKSRSYVYGRLKLCALSTEVREQFLDNAISASTALLIARIPTPALQRKALDEIVKPSGWPPEPMSYRRAAEHIQNRYMLDLATAIFPIADGKLLSAAGSCVKCPKRTGNQPEIFEDVKGADVCTDPDCFGEKRAAHHGRTIVMANKKGIPVLEGAEGLKAIPQAWLRDSEFVKGESNIFYFERNAPQTKNNGTLADHLSEDALPRPAYYVKKDDGSVLPIYKRIEVQAALEKAGVCETAELHAARMAAEDDEPEDASIAANNKSERERMAAIDNKATQETKFRVELYKKLRTRGAAGFSLQTLREFVKLVLIDDNNYALPNDLVDLYGLDNYGDESVCAYIDKATLPEVQLILVDIVMGECLGVERWQIDEGGVDEDDRYKSLMAMAQAEGIEHELVREEVLPTPLDVNTLQYDDLVRIIKATPQRINELSKAVLADGYLVSALERAANNNGFVYSTNGFVRAGAPSEDVAALASDVSSSVAVDPISAEGDDGENLTAQMAEEESKPAASTRSKKKSITKLAPAAAWPFPLTSGSPASESQAVAGVDLDSGATTETAAA